MQLYRHFNELASKLAYMSDRRLMISLNMAQQLICIKHSNHSSKAAVIAAMQMLSLLQMAA